MTKLEDYFDCTICMAMYTVNYPLLQDYTLLKKIYRLYKKNPTRSSVKLQQTAYEIHINFVESFAVYVKKC